MKNAKRDPNNSLNRVSVRQALRLCRSPIIYQKLENHHFAKMKMVEKVYRSSPRKSRGQILKEILFQALQELKQGTSENLQDVGWIHYKILYEQFVKDTPRITLIELLHISYGQYYKYQNDALDRYVSILRDWEAKADEIDSEEALNTSPLVPSQPLYELIGRKSQLVKIKQEIFANNNRSNIALLGRPGVGKTALVINLAYDGEVRKHFPDGVLWVGLGRNPDIPGWLGEWSKEMGISPKELEGMDSIQDRLKRLRRALLNKRMLIIIDEACSYKAALKFKLGGRYCSHILTTRIPNIAMDFAGDGVETISELNEEDGTALLRNLGPKILDSEIATKLVRKVGGSPLGLILIGKFLKFEGRYNDKDRLNRAIQKLNDRLELLNLNEEQLPTERHPSLPLEANISLNNIISISYEALDKEAADAFLSLSVFPPKPNTFSKEAALAVSDKPISVLERLFDSGLVESVASNRFTLHQIIWLFASEKLTINEPNYRTIEYYLEFLSTLVSAKTS